MKIVEGCSGQSGCMIRLCFLRSTTILHFCTAYCVILGKETASKVFLYCPRKAPYNHTCQTSFVRSDFQTSNAVWKCRMPFLLPKLWAIWKFWPSGAILSFSLRLQDSMAPSGQNFHTAPAFGGRNVTDYLDQHPTIAAQTAGLSHQEQLLTPLAYMERKRQA